MHRDDFLLLVSRELDGVASPDEVARLKAARTESPELDRLAADIAGLSGTLRSLPTAPVPAGLADRVATQALAARPGPLLRFVQLHRMAGVAAALLIMVSLGGVVGWMAGPGATTIDATPEIEDRERGEEMKLWRELGAPETTITAILQLKDDAAGKRKDIDAMPAGEARDRAMAAHDLDLQRRVFELLPPEVRQRWCARNGLDPRFFEEATRNSSGR